MAAHLKKRVYEEFTRVVQQQLHEEIPAKKLRLTKPSKSAALHIDLCKSTSPAEALQYLLQFAKKPVEAESVEGVVRILLDHYYKESESSVRLKIASLIGLLSKTSGFVADCIIDDVIIALNNEKSHHVLAQLLDTILVIGIQLQDNLPLGFRLVEIGCKHLVDTSHVVRKKCLQLIGGLGSLDKPTAKELENLAAKDVQKIISDSFVDQDPRVRMAAMKAMLQLHERGMKLQQTIYCQACKALSDDYEQVRSVAVQLVWVLSQLYADSIVPIPSSNEEIRLIDDAFGKVCHMVNDGSWMVRVQAAKLLGSMHQVSVQFLEQTLDKKLMSDLKRKRSAHERAKELYTSGEFSSGRKWGDDAPKEAVDTYTVNLMNSGACGAFVHGLEDEMYEVRNAAVEALCMLAQASASFAEKCLDFLVDMFNDEIEEVRLGSIHALRKISSHIRLREDQLDTVLAVLEDSSRDIREALHELLCYTNVSTKDGIHLALVELLKNLAKYPTDRNSIWKCLKYLGSRHPTLVLPLVPELLSTHPYFDTPEPDMDDPAYIAVLVLVFNAAKICPTMSALFSDHTFRHYAYLRDSLSHLVPPLQGPAALGGATARVGGNSGIFGHIPAVPAAPYEVPPGEAVECGSPTISQTERHGSRCSETNSGEYVQAGVSVQRPGEQSRGDHPPHAASGEGAAADPDRTYHPRVRGRCAQPASGRVNRAWPTASPFTERMETLINMCEKFLQEIEAFPRCFASELQYLQESFVEKLLEIMPRLVACKPAEMVKILQTTLHHSSFLLLNLPEQVHRASATIIEPTGESDNPLRFTSGLVVALDIDATLEHVQDPQNAVKVQVMYPDGQAHTIHPKPADFRNPGPGRHRLITQVYLSHSAWTEPCQVEVRLLLAYSSSRSRTSGLCTASRPAWSDSVDGVPQTESVIEGTINLSRPVKVYLMPKPARR
uniref:integrator complex subunit 4 isoform X2 n=1 Tax=Pristiophorus japonicus TaxID=55135 RepID=UPI00398F85E7